MSVNPGFGGQKFIESTYSKLEKLQKIIRKHDLKLGNNLSEGEIAVEVDGGIYPGEIPKTLIANGANVLVAGSAVYGADDANKAIQNLKDERKD